MPSRIVIDTNVYLSHLMPPASVPSRALLRAWRHDLPLVSSATLEELENTLNKAKFAKYFRPLQIAQFLEEIDAVSVRIGVQSSIQACRDPKDDKFLELAVDGHADLILSGDRDLLILSPFRGIPIVSPMQYLAED
jgi:putative PIN family toxin of toxin-antitoxin system